MKLSGKGLILFTPILFIFFILRSRPVEAQTEELIVAIDRPGEGEHIYAGPNTLLYSIPIAGWVYCEDYSYNEIGLTLEIYQGGDIIIETPLRLDSDNLFTIHATVNPESTFDPFAPYHGVDCDACHHAGTIDLVSGHLKIRVIARDPKGREAIAERNIVVDLSSYTTVPIQLEMLGESQYPFRDIPITASTRLYMWRTRHSTGLTDVNGYASVKVEALSEARTHYTFEVEPTEVNGVIYESIEPVEVSLSPGVAQIEPVTLRVMAQSGEIYGHLIFERDRPEKVWAINQNYGTTYESDVSMAGDFRFQDLPFSHYILTLDCEALQGRNQTCPQKIVHLINTEPVKVTLTAEAHKNTYIQFEFRSEEGRPLPFVWLEAEGHQLTVTARPHTGNATLSLPLGTEPIALLYISPGSKQQKQEITLADINSTFEIQLETQPEIKHVDWGEGTIVIPPETQATVEEDRIRFTSGWLWGSGKDSFPLIIETPEGQISLDGGTFALEKLQNQNCWLYLTEGKAQVTLQNGRAWSVHDGEMLSLAEGNFQGPVPMQDIAIDRIRSNDVPADLLEANLQEPILKDRFTAAQVVQMITLILIIILVLLLFSPSIRRVQFWLLSRLSAHQSDDMDSDDDV